MSRQVQSSEVGSNSKLGHFRSGVILSWVFEVRSFRSSVGKFTRRSNSTFSFSTLSTIPRWVFFMFSISTLGHIDVVSYSTLCRIRCLVFLTLSPSMLSLSTFSHSMFSLSTSSLSTFSRWIALIDTLDPQVDPRNSPGHLNFLGNHIQDSPWIQELSAELTPPPRSQDKSEVNHKVPPWQRLLGFYD